MALEGLGQARRLAEEAAWEIAAGEPINVAVNLKAANLKQLSAIMAFACAKGGFPTLNSHLYLDELAGLGWRDLQPMIADPWKGEEALIASIAALEDFGAPARYISEYQAIFRHALDGQALDMLRIARDRGNVPRFLAYEHVKTPDPEAHRREPKILIFCWPPTVVFPDAPVFHAQPVNTPQSQYGALNVAPGLIISRLFDPELASAGDLELHVVGAVYGRKLAWAMAHDGQEPPPQVVDAWRPLQASHRLQGPISLRRNWNHRFLTLEREYSSDWRRTCGVVLLKKLTSSMQLSAVSREHLEESQAIGSQPREGDLSLIVGSNMLLAEMYAYEEEIERFCKDNITGGTCSMLHSHAPCKFWSRRYGAVPNAVAGVPINDRIPCENFLVWPPQLE